MDPQVDPARDVRFLSVRGRGTAPGRACGRVVRNRDDLPPERLDGAILIAERAVPEDVPRILASRGTVTVGGALLSHVGLLSREFGRPSISLRSDSGARLLDDDDGAIVGFEGIAGVARPVLREGDVVLVDGDRGLLSIPGGLDPERSERVAATWRGLAAFARAPDADRAVRAAVATDDVTLEFALDAGLRYGAVPRGDATGLWLSALGARFGIDALAPRLRATGDAIRRETVADVERLRGRIATADADELGRLRARVEARRAEWGGLVDDLDADPGEVRVAIDAFARDAESRAAALHDDLRRDLDAEAGHPDDVLSHRLGAARRLVRRAIAAGLADGAVIRLGHRVDRLVAEARERAGGRLIVPLDDAGVLADRESVGGKAVGLLRAAPRLPAGCRIPRGFVLTTAAYRRHLVGEAGERVREAIEAGDDPDVVSRRARAAILGTEPPSEVADAVRAALVPLGRGSLAVRSSATVEDGPEASLAGQFDSWLGVTGEAAVLDRIRWCWASLWNGRAIRTLAGLGRSPLDTAQAVLIQVLSATRAGGVMVTRDPITGRRDALLVNAAWGLGEGVSHGTATGDLFWVDRDHGESIEVEPSGATSWVVPSPDGAGTVDAPLPPARVGRPCLDATDLRRLAELARALEATAGSVLEVEFGFDGDDLVVFQVRRVRSDTR